MKVYTVFVILLSLFMFIYKQMKDKMVGKWSRVHSQIRTNELYIGYYIGLCLMMCLNCVVISVLYGSQSNLIEIAAGKRVAITLFRAVASCSIFIIFFYVSVIP